MNQELSLAYTTVVVNGQNSDIRNGELKKFFYAGQADDSFGRKLRVVIPDGISGIGAYAFEGNHIKSVSIGKDVQSIHCAAFSRCKSLNELIVASKNPELHSRDNCIIRTSVKRMIIGCKSSKIPDDGSVEGIWSAFYECSGLTRIVIPEGVTAVGAAAFYGCCNLEEIFLPESLNRIGHSSGLGTLGDVVEGCARLEKIVYAGSAEQWYQISGRENMVHSIICADGKKVKA